MMPNANPLYDRSQLFISIGNLALRASKEMRTDLVDLSEWVANRNITKLPNQGSESDHFFHKLLESYTSEHNFVDFDPIFPTFANLSILNSSRTVELADLVLATTLMTPIIEEINEKKLGQLDVKGADFLDPKELVPLLLFWDKKCVVTLDHMDLSLIDALIYIASRLEIKIDRAKRRKLVSNGSGTLDPAIRIRYEILKHVPKTELLSVIRKTVTPIQDLAGLIGFFPCVISADEGPQHGRLSSMLNTLTDRYLSMTECPTQCVVDNNDLVK